jgi:hypothetical protein
MGQWVVKDDCTEVRITSEALDDDFSGPMAAVDDVEAPVTVTVSVATSVTVVMARRWAATWP